MPLKITLPKNQELKKLKEDEKIMRELPFNETPTPRESPRAERSSPRTFGDRMTRFK